MPPKELLKDITKGTGKVYIRNYECKEWQEFGNFVKDAITITEEAPTPESINTTGAITFKFHCKVDPRWQEFLDAINKLCNAYKHRKHRKPTYKTIRHDCAKRNGRR